MDKEFIVFHLSINACLFVLFLLNREFKVQSELPIKPGRMFFVVETETRTHTVALLI